MRFSSRVDRVLIGWAIAVLCALLLALAALALINRIIYNPAGQVSQYFAAVRDGNGERALGILGAELPEAGTEKFNGAMLDGAALSQSMENLTDLEVEETTLSENGEKATVTVSYKLSGEERTTDFHLSKVGSHWGVFDQWHIDPAQLPLVHINSSAVSAATLNNQKVAVDGGSRDFAVVYPGEYTATYESALYQSKSQTAQVTAANQKTQTVTIALVPSETAQNSIAHQIKSQLDECATQNSLYPAGCPFEYDFNGRVQGDVKWTIKNYPQPKATINSQGNWVLPKSKGSAQISFDQIDLYTGNTSTVNKTVEFTYSGTLQTTDTEVVVRSQ